MKVGIDISKLKFDVVLLTDEGKHTHKTFTNNDKGFASFKEWLNSLEALTAHCCMEATGRYGEELALFLSQNALNISVINPARIKAFARSEGVRVKTDKVDAGIIARFCKVYSPETWVPPSAETQAIRDLYRCLQDLEDDKQRCENRMEKLHKEKSSFKTWKEMADVYAQKIQEKQKKIEELIDASNDLNKNKALLESIKGIGFKRAVALLSELPNINLFKNAKEAAAFAGLTPSIRQSGSSLQCTGSLSKVGNARLRKALYMPAVVAIRHNPIIKEFYNRLLRNGKRKMVALIAVMRKLLHIIFGVLKHQEPFRCDLKT